MCGNCGIGHAKKPLCHNASHFEAVKVLLLYFPQDSLQRLPDLCRSNYTEEHHLHFACQEKEVPLGSVDSSVHCKAIESLNDTPILQVWLTLQGKNFGH